MKSKSSKTMTMTIILQIFMIAAVVCVVVVHVIGMRIVMMNKGDAMRFNEGKAPLSLIAEARHALNGCASVLEFGAKKYARGNWHKGLSHTQICDSMLRHLSAYLSGEDNDPESGLRHVDHIMCNALFLAEGTVTHPELDDRSEELKNDLSS